MNKFNLGEWVLDHQKAAVTIVAILLLIPMSFYINLRFDNTPDSFFMSHDPTLKMYDHYKETFGSDEYTFIVLEAPETWNSEFIDHITQLTETLEDMLYVTRVTSITNARLIQGVNDAIDVGAFIDDAVIESSQDLAKLRTTALAHPFYKDFLISADGTKLGILAQTELRPKEVMYKIEIAQGMRDLLASEPFSQYQPRLVGAPVIDADVFKIINIESALFGTLSFTVVAIGFFFIFRSWVGTFLPLTVATCSIMFAAGLMAIIDAPAGLLTPIIPGFLISVGVGSSVFLLFEIYQQRIAGLSLREAIVHAYRTSALTSIISVATTAGALLSFSWSEIKPVQEAGLVMAGGLLASVVFALLLIPMVLWRFDQGDISHRLADLLTKRNKMVEAIAGFVINRWKMVLAGLAVSLVVAVGGLSQLRVDYHYVGLFKENTDIYQSYTYVDNSLRGSASMEVLFNTEGNSQLDIKDAALLNQMDSFQRQLEANFTELGLKTYSVVDVVKEINQALHGGDSEYYRIPESRAAIAEALFLFESTGSDELDNFVAADYQQARVNLRLKYRPESEYASLFAQIDQTIEQDIQPSLDGVSVNLTGVIPLWSRLTTYLYETEVEAITLSALVVMCVMMLVFRSIRLGFMMAFCNLVPVAFTLAAMGYMGIFLDPFTMLVSAIAIGMLDDDTIHFVRGFLVHYKNNGHDVGVSLRYAYANAGQAMVLLSLVLIAGFLVYNLSEVASLAKFGTMTALAIGFGALSEFLFTPAVIILCERLGLLPAKQTGIYKETLLPQES